MHVVFVNRFYWPETPATGQLLTDLAEGLALRGLTIEVVASRRDATVSPREFHRGVHIHRVRGTRLAKRFGVLGKAADFATFFISALWRTSRLARRNSVVVSLTDPPLLGLGLNIAARARGARLVQWVQDIYPEIAIALASAHALRLILPFRNHTWRDSDACVTLGRDMARRLKEAGVDDHAIHIIPNWALANTSTASAGELSALRRSWDLEGRFILLYSGNLGRVHDLDAVLDLAAALRDDARIAIVFVGDGAQREALTASARDRALTNVHFKPPQPRKHLSATLALADVHLVTLRADCADLVFPSKLYGAAAAARPIVFIGPDNCDVAQIVADNGIGLVVSRANVTELAPRIRALVNDSAARDAFASRASDFARRNDLAGAVDAWTHLLTSVHTGFPCALRHRATISS